MVLRPYLLVLSLSLFAVAACGDSASGGTCECSPETVQECTADGQSLIVKVPTLTCDDGECVTLDSQQVCEFGCFEGACRVNDAACDTVTCDDPPPNFCEGNQTIVYQVPGTCGVGGVCTYERRRESCGVDAVCVQGECRPLDCSFTTCDEPPTDLCEGDVALVHPALGACSDDAGTPVCSYEPARRDCAAEAARCESGRCIDLCGGVLCTTPPPPTCEADVAVTAASRGECTAGACSYEELRRDCATDGLVCESGECVARCSDNECVTPPDDACSDDGRERIVYERVGACDDAESCLYEELTRVDCTLDGEVCLDGACVIDPLCVDVDCSAPSPANLCDGEIAVTLVDGLCIAGDCQYARLEVDCAAAGQLCIDGACVDRCAVDACLTPPMDICVGEAAWQYGRPGVCDTTDGCEYPLFITDCALRGESCVDGQCEPGCDCDDVPSDRRCESDFVVGFVAGGVCDGDACIFDEEVLEDCSDLGAVCALGVCAPDCGAAPCLPLEPRCDGDSLIVSTAPGICLEGDVCDYTAVEETIDCRADGLACVDGACVDACEFLTCDVRPADVCDGDTLIVSTFPSFCADSACQFEETRIDCTVSGDVCFDGACVDPCLGILCDDPPENICDGSVVEAYRAVGACTAGICDYGADSFDCSLLGQECVDASCVDPCADVTCDDVPADGCVDGVALTYSGLSVCAGGVCEYLLRSRADCGAIGLACVDAACVDPCDGVVCDTPPPATCDADVSNEFVAAGTCSGGACEYTPTASDCSLFGARCVAGDCEDRCTAQPCTTGDDYCEGNTAIAYAPTTCAFGVCTEQESRTDCGATGQACVDGACVTTATPCDVLVCAPPADHCESDSVAVSYVGAGVCSAAEPSCDYSTVRVATPCAAGETCVDGACARHVAPGEVIISELFFDGVGSDDGQEWVELLNVSASTLSLRGLALVSPTGQTLALAADAEIGPGATYLLSGDSALVGDQSFTFFEFSFSNLGGEIALVNDTGTVDVVSISAVTGWSWQAGSSLSTRNAAQSATGNDSPGGWCVPTASYRPGVFGTPGDANDGC